MTPYLDLLKECLDQGKIKEDRTGTGTRSLFGRQIRYDLSEGLPLVTTKKLHLPSVIHELLWFISGNTNVKYLQNNGVRIWNEWADENGDLGPVYGAQWRSWGGMIDQLAEVIEEAKRRPHSRRLIVSAWNPSEIPSMALAPCHTMFQIDITDGKVNLQLYQRSADIFLGVPFNIASYCILLHMITQCLKEERNLGHLEVGEFVHTFGDVHLYNNHVEQAKEQLARMPLGNAKLWLQPNILDIDEFTYDDIMIYNYDYHPPIKGDVAI